MSPPPRMPPETCPTIDEAIGLMEDVRKANQALRENAEHYMELAETLEFDLSEAERDVQRLEEEVAGLKEELNEKTRMEGQVVEAAGA